MIKHYDAQKWLRETQPKRAKFTAVLVAIFVTLLTSAFAGLRVGLCCSKTFWYWAIGIAVISLPYILMDRVSALKKILAICTDDSLQDYEALIQIALIAEGNI